MASNSNQKHKSQDDICGCPCGYFFGGYGRKRSGYTRGKEEEEDRKCVICLEERKLTIREWTKRDGTLARQFHRARTQKFFFCSGWVHTTCMMEWVKENGRLLLLFKCPYCRSIGCDMGEMEAFRDGELKKRNTRGTFISRKKPFYFKKHFTRNILIILSIKK